MGRMERNKGAVGERELAKELSRLFNVEAHRGRQYQGSPESPDVRVDIPDIHVECKRVEQFRIYEAIEQAASEAPAGAVPVVCHRKNNRRWLLVAYLDDVPDLAVKLFHTMAENA